MIRTGRGVLYESTLDCLLKTAKSEGPMTVFRGFNMQWLRLGPHTTISLMCFEQLRHLDTWKHVLSFSSSPFQNLNFDSYSTPRSSTELRQNSTAFLLLQFVAFFSFHSLGLLLSRVANPPSPLACDRVHGTSQWGWHELSLRRPKVASYFLHCMYGVYKRCNVGCWDAVAPRHATVLGKVSRPVEQPESAWLTLLGTLCCWDCSKRHLRFQPCRQAKVHREAQKLQRKEKSQPLCLCIMIRSATAHYGLVLA